MNWRNPFLVTYLAVTVVGTAILGFLAYSAWTNALQADEDYVSAVQRLHQLQNRAPYPSDANNAKYIQYTKDYRAEYDKLVAKASSMQKPLEAITPQAFQDRLRANVSQVEQAAKENGVKLQDGFYLGFDQYQGTLPSEAAAPPLARELAAIRLVVDQLIQLKVQEIVGIKRDALPEEGGARVTSPPPSSGNKKPKKGGPVGSPAPASNVVVSNSFEIVFIASQNATRSALNSIADSDQFFIIRYLNVQNSSLDGPKIATEEVATTPQDPSQPAAAAPSTAAMRLIVGRETLTVALRIEMITFNNLPTKP